MQASATMTTAAHLPIPSFPRNNSLYTAMSGGSSYLPQFTSPIATGYPAMHTNYLYGGSSVNISPHHFPTSSAAGFGVFSPTEPSLNGLSPSPVNKHPHPIAGQMSPSSNDHHPHRQRIASTTNDNISPLPTPSPPGPAQSPGSSSLLPSFPPVNPPPSHTHKNYTLPPNGFPTNNGMSYFPGATPSLNGSTQHHLLQNSVSHTPTTLNGSPFNPSSYTPNLSHLPSLPAVTPLPPAPASTVSMFPSQLPMHGQGDYSQQPAAIGTNVSSPSLPAPLNMNLWGSNYPLHNQVHPMHKLSYDTPRYKLTPERATPLVKWFDEHKDHPYPSRHEKILLCQQTQLTFTQVSTWFANCRRRMKKANQEEEERNSTQGSTSGSDSPGPRSNSSCVSDNQGLEGHSSDPLREHGGDISSSTAPDSYSSRHDTD